MNKSNQLEDELGRALEDDLLKLYGPLLSGAQLTKCLGYRSQDAFRTSISRKTVPVTVFKIEGRRGYHALTKEVALYLAKARYRGQSGG